MYQWGLQKYLADEDLKSYIENNYSLKQIGFMKTDTKIQTIYLLLKKGGSMDFENITGLASDKTESSKTYRLTEGRKVNFYYIDI